MPLELSVRDRWDIVHRSVVDRQSQAAISKATGHSRNTIRLWLNRFKETGNVLDLPRSGRPRISTPEQDQWLRTASLKNRTRSAADLQGSCNANSETGRGC
jgi:transposase